MIDRGAFPFVPSDLTGLFRRLNGLAIYDILDTLDALLKEKKFNPDFRIYRAQLDSAGIAVRRMEVAMSTVQAKNARMTWEKFQEVHLYDFVNALVPQEVGYIKDYWAAGPTPGLHAETVPINPSIANEDFGKYVDMFTECKYDVNYAVPPYIPHYSCGISL